MRKLSVVLFILTALTLLNGCAAFESLTVKDRIVYADEGPLGAVGFHTLQTDSWHVSKDQWDKDRMGLLCIDADTFGDIKANEQKACSMLPGGCTYEQEKAVNTFFFQVARAQAQGRKAKSRKRVN